MSFVIQQTDEYAGDGRWDWSVWIDGPDAELDRVVSVDYVLHPTFPDPLRTVTRRASKFRLEGSGWGEFEIHAHVTTDDGRRQHLKHWLRLGEPGRVLAKAAVPAKPAVFISAGIADAGWEEAVHDALEERGVEVLTTSDVPTGVPVEDAISSTLDKADAVVGIFSGKPGPWAEREVKKALEKEISVIPVLVGPDAKLPAQLQSVQAVHASNLREVDAVTDQIVDRLG